MDDFNRGAALVLDKLYTAFPQRVSFRISALDQNADENTIVNYRDTVLFLEREGFIRYGSWANSDPPMFEEVTLTSKGLAVLNSEPEILKEKVTLGEKLSAALKAGSIEAIKTLINQVIASTVSGYLKL